MFSGLLTVILIGLFVESVIFRAIEARAAVNNDHANAALKTLGGRREATLKEAFLQDDQFVDQYLWAFLDSRWSPVVPRRTR